MNINYDVNVNDGYDNDNDSQIRIFTADIDDKTKSKTRSREEWRLILSDFNSSGLNIREYCKLKGINESGFNAFLHREKQRNKLNKDINVKVLPIKLLEEPTYEVVINNVTIKSNIVTLRKILGVNN